jgi:hypothetical protein
MKKSALDEFGRDIIALAKKYEGRLVIVGIAQEIEETGSDGKFTCTGRLKAWDNHRTAGPEALCSAHYIMHQNEGSTPSTERDISKCH